MKINILKSTIIILALSMVSFTTLTKKEVNVKESNITWKGHKVTGSHEGTISLASGSLEFEGATLVGGAFQIDMTSITNTDMQGEYSDKLVGHLKSDDFFGVAKFPSANLKFTKVKASDSGSYNVTGDLTVKGQTHPIAFTLTINGNSASTSLKVDRTKYGVKYGSASFFDNLKDKAIYDEFDLDVALKF